MHHTYSSNVFIYTTGGFAWTGISFVAMNDMWALYHYDDAPTVAWIQINPVSATPLQVGIYGYVCIHIYVYIRLRMYTQIRMYGYQCDDVSRDDVTLMM